MNITTPLRGMQNDLSEEVRQFFHEDDINVRHIMEDTGGVHLHTVTITVGDRQAQIRCEGARENMESRAKTRADKHAAKRACYRALCALSGQTQPWGSLTGVRPTVLLRALMRAGRQNAFTQEYDVQPNKYELAREIIDIQESLMRHVEQDAVCVYIGIPFCISRCSYCSFPGRIAKKGEMEAYIKALLLEMDAAKEAIEAHRSPIASVYIGGGTPTSLPVTLLEKLLAHTRACFPKAPEFTLEAGRPDTLDRDKLRVAGEYGVNRICINPQTMVDRTLQRIGRSHTAADIENAVDMAKHAGFNHINMDIIAGLPGETQSDFYTTLSRIRNMAPAAFTCHTLSLKRGSRLLLKNHTLCDTKTASIMVDRARSCAHEMGMHPYYMYRQKYMAGNLENVGYAKAGQECVYNVAMMDEMLPVMGLGVGAVGKVISGDVIRRIPNPRDLFVYLERLDRIVQQKRRFYGVDKEIPSVYNNSNGNDEDA